jgi:hypothetical protein
MGDSFARLIQREAGGGGGGGRRRRSRPPPSRAPFVAHPCTDWTPEHVEEHLAACQRGRDASGQWDIDLTDPAEIWAWIWELTTAIRPDGSLDWGPWAPFIREVEVP